MINNFNKIILIGMPGAGKTTVMNHLSKKNYQCIDLDPIIEPDIESFSKLALLDRFIEKEHEIFKKLVLTNYKLISTGGSVPCDLRNRNILKNPNYYVVWLDIPINIIEKRIGGMNGAIKRGVCFDKCKSLKEVYEHRYSFYEECCDLKIENKDINKTIKTIEEILIKIEYK